VQKTESEVKIAIKSTSGVKKDDTFQLIAHDGVRFLKLVLLMPNQVSIIRNLRARNKFYLKSGIIDNTSERGTTVILVDHMEQIEFLFCESTSEPLTEAQHAIQGLPIKYTNAPKFVFLSDTAKESGEK
jgi:hypothetical protein